MTNIPTPPTPIPLVHDTENEKKKDETVEKNHTLTALVIFVSILFII